MKCDEKFITFEINLLYRAACIVLNNRTVFQCFTVHFFISLNDKHQHNALHTAERVASISGDPCGTATRVTAYTGYTLCCHNTGNGFYGF